MDSIDETKKVFRCPKCNLVPLIDYYLENSEKNNDFYEQKIKIICRNNHSQENIDFDDFLESYSKEENKDNIDSLCVKHNKKIEKICEKCKLNLCFECSHNCKKILQIKELYLTEKEKNNIKENLNKFNPFFENLKKIAYYCDNYIYFYEKNKKLLNFAEIIFSIYLKYEKYNCLSFEIIENCRACLRFKYNQLSLELIYEKLELELYLEPKNYIILPLNYIIFSKKLTEYHFESDSIKDSYFSLITELLDDKFAMVYNNNIYIYKNDSLNSLYTIKIDINLPMCSWDEKITSICCSHNGNLIASSYDGKIYIFKILDNSYEKLY